MNINTSNYVGSSKALLDEPMILLQRTLARALEDVERACIVQQLHYLLLGAPNDEKHIREGRKWIWRTLDEWYDDLNFIGERTFRRKLKHLEEIGLIISDNFNEMEIDQTKWYTIDYDVLNKLVENTPTYESKRAAKLKERQERKKKRKGQNVQVDGQIDQMGGQNGQLAPEQGGHNGQLASSSHGQNGQVPGQHGQLNGSGSPNGKGHDDQPNNQRFSESFLYPIGSPVRDDRVPIPAIMWASAYQFRMAFNKQGITEEDCEAFRLLEKIHTPAAIQSEFAKVLKRIETNGQITCGEQVITRKEDVPMLYIWKSMQGWTSLNQWKGGNSNAAHRGGAGRGNPNRDNKDYGRGSDGVFS